MIRFSENFQLKNYHTFGTDVRTKYFFEFTECSDLADFFASGKDFGRILLIGSGSNLLFLNDFEGLVMQANIPGIKRVTEDRNNVWLEVGAGVEWDELVAYAAFYNWGGIENLSLIPGKVGSSPVQNIGAYGVEARDVIESVTGFDLKTMEEYQLSAADCRFAYRDSIFKHELKERFVVTSVVVKLDKYPEFKLDYGDLKSEVDRLGGPTVASVRQAVIAIRQSKLPDPKELGNAGSFFKNPVVEPDLAEVLRSRYEKIPLYASTEGKTKLAAGWLIDQCGWKGYREGDAGVHEKQALVLVNYGNASGPQIIALSEKIQQSVYEKFGVHLEPEVNVIR